MRYLSFIPSTLLFLVIAIQPFEMYSQVELKWEQSSNNQIKWQHVTALGSLIISHRDGLSELDTETGDQIWNKAEYANLDKTYFQELVNSPFISIENKDGFSLVDQFSGDVVFNSSEVGITKLNDYFLLYDTGAILVAGLGSNGDPLLGLVNMADGQLAWTMDDKFDRIIEVSELENESLLLVTIFNIYNIDAGTGKVIWKAPTSKEAENINKLGGAFGKFVKDAANKMTDQVDIKLDYYEHPNKPIF